MIKSATFGLMFFFLAGCFGTVRGNEQARPLTKILSSDFQYRLHSNDRTARANAAYLKGRYAEKTGDLEGAAGFLKEAARLTPKPADILVDLAHLQLRRGEIEAAVRAAEDALLSNPDHFQGRLLLSDIELRRGRLSEAITHLQKLLELRPDHEEAAVNLAVTYARDGQHEQATDLLKRFLARKPDALNARLALARIYRELGLRSSSAMAYDELVERYPHFEMAYREWADMLADSGQNEKAEAVLRRALSEIADPSHLRHQLTGLLLRQGKLNDARRELDLLLEQSPDDLEAKRKLGLLEMEQGNWGAAEQIFSSILQQKPGHAQSLYHLGSALEEQQRWDEALDVFERVSQESVLYPDALVHASYLHQRRGEDDLARRQLEKAIEHAPDRHQYYVYLASLLDEQGRYDEAITTLEQARRSTARGSAEISYRIGILQGKLKQWDQAVAQMRRVLEEQAEHADALNYLAYHFAETGSNLDEALELARKALALKNVGYIQDTLGWVYFRLDRLDEALRHLKKAARELPDDPLVWEHLGDVQDALGHREKANEAYRRALELDPESDSIKNKLERAAEGGM